MLRHRQGRGGDSPSENRRRRPQCLGDGRPGLGEGDARVKVYQGTRIQGNPSDKPETLLSSSSRQKLCCGQPRVAPRSKVQSVPTRLEKLVHPQYPHNRGREPGNTNSYSNWALAE